MLKIVVKSQEVEIKKGTSRAGKPYVISEQTVYLQTADEVRRFSVALKTGQTPYAPGEYALAPESFTVGQWGSLEIGRVELVRIPAAASGSKAA